MRKRNFINASFALYEGFSTKPQTSRHIKSVHEGKRPHSCKANVSSKEILYNHIKTVYEGKKFECKICDAKFTSKNVSN